MDILETDAYDRRLRRNTSCILFVSLLPFFLAAAAYFYLWIPDSSPSMLAAGVKAAPVLLLALLVLSYNGGQSILGVAGGLVISAAGDCCLIWSEMFLQGMAAFALTHLFYSLTFLSARYSTASSSSGCSVVLCVLLWLGGAGLYTYLFSFMQGASDSAILTPAVGVYIILLAQLLIAVGDIRAAQSTDDFAKWKRS